MRDASPFELPGIAYRRCAFAVENSEMASDFIYDFDTPIIIPLPHNLRTAVTKRKAEFLAGRLCATLALRSHGLTTSSIPRKPDRSPLWPIGFVGSITHVDGYAAAVVARANQYAILGLDLELIIPADQAVSIGSLVLGPTEQTLQPCHLDFQTFLTLAFCAKEALYKAIYPYTGRVLEFHDVLLKDLDETRVKLELARDARTPNLPQFSFSANYQIGGGECICIVAA